MSVVPFSWMWGDPADSVDRLRSLKVRMAMAEKEFKERELRNRRRHVRRLVKMAKARELKGQR